MYGLNGAFTINGEAVQAFDTIHFETVEHAETISIEATEKMSLVVFSGKPIKEPVEAQGPFVMNTKDELREAFASYRNGTFLEGAPY